MFLSRTTTSTPRTMGRWALRWTSRFSHRRWRITTSLGLRCRLTTSSPSHFGTTSLSLVRPTQLRRSHRFCDADRKVILSGTSGSLASLSGGFAYGAGVSGLITPGYGMSPTQSGLSTPHHGIPTSADHMMQSHAHHQMALDPRQQGLRC